MKYLNLVLIALLSISLHAQDPSPYDFGRMWTFENPPKEWFKKAYNFDADDEWFAKARKSSVRFATWCSASFVSPGGLLMTNQNLDACRTQRVQIERRALR
jgi:hypothetical protein